MVPSVGDCKPGAVDRKAARSEQEGALGWVRPAGPPTGLSAAPASRPPTEPQIPSPASARPAARRFARWGEGGELSCVLFRPLLKFRGPPFAAPQGAAYSIAGSKIGAAVRAEPGLPRGLRSGANPRAVPCTRRAGALGPGHLGGRVRRLSLAPAWGTQSHQPRLLRGLRTGLELGSGVSGAPSLAAPLRSAPGVPRACGHPIRPLAAPGIRQALPPPPPQRNELSTAALGAARGHPRIYPRAANPPGGRPPWEGME